VCVLALLHGAAQAQVTENWVSLFNPPGAEEWTDMAMDAAGNVYVTGRHWGEGTVHYVTARYSPDGDLLWAQQFGTTSVPIEDDAVHLALDSCGCVYLTCKAPGPTTSWDIATVKYSPEGEELWVEYVDGQGREDQGRALAVTSGGVVVAGTAFTNNGGTRYVTIQYDGEGRKEWAHVYTPAFNSGGPLAVAVDAQDNVIVLAVTYDSNGSPDFLLLKYCCQGELLWSRVYGGYGPDFPEDLALDEVGNIYAAGFGYGTFPGTLDLILLAYDPDGEMLWEQIWDSPNHDWEHGGFVAVHETGVYWGGKAFTTLPGHNSTYQLFKYSFSGEELWWYSKGDTLSHHILEDMAVDAQGNVYLTGRRTLHYAVGEDGVTVKVGPDGVEQWAVTYAGASNSIDEALVIALDGEGNPAVAGQTHVEPVYQAFVVKYGTCLSAAPDPVADRAALQPLTVSPNPFNPETALGYRLSAPGWVSLQVYDTAGRETAKLVNGWQDAGAHEVTFDGAGLPSGIYFVRLQAGEGMAVQKIVLLK